MAEGIPSAFPVELTRKWRALAERRKAYLVDLYDSGRWRLYYSEQDFVRRLREAIRIVEQWSATEQSATRGAAMVPTAAAAADGCTAFSGAGAERPSRAEADDSAGHVGPDAVTRFEIEADAGACGDADAATRAAIAADDAGSSEEPDPEMRRDTDLLEREVA